MFWMVFWRSAPSNAIAGNPRVYLHDAAQTHKAKARPWAAPHLEEHTNDAFSQHFSTQGLASSTSQATWNWRVSLKRGHTAISAFTRRFSLRPWVFRLSMVFTGVTHKQTHCSGGYVQPLLRSHSARSGAGWPRDSCCRRELSQDPAGRAPATRSPQHLGRSGHLNVLPTQPEDTLAGKSSCQGSPKISKWSQRSATTPAGKAEPCPAERHQARAVRQQPRARCPASRRRPGTSARKDSLRTDFTTGSEL